MSESALHARGACYCGAVVVKLAAPLSRPINCHCGQCRRLSGAAFSTWITARRSDMVVEGGDALQMFEPTSNLERYFCKHCGSHVYTADRRLPRHHGFPAGLFEGQAIEAPQREYFVDHKASWQRLPLDGECFGGPNGSEPVVR